MKSYRITPEAKQQIENDIRPNGTGYLIRKDINGDFFIWEIEHQCCGLGIEAEFVPPPTPEEENL